MTAARKRTPSISNKEHKKHSETSSVLPTPRTRLVFIWSIVAVTIGVLIAKHPKASSFASDFLPPADKLLADLENWGNFTVSSRIRQTVLEMFDSSLLTSQADVPFYIDIISDSNSTIKRPTVFIPGYITSGLEIWESLPCAKTKFRERIWGTASMVKLLITDAKCWVQHMLLSPVSTSDGKTLHYTDPPGVRIRASTGLGAADYVIGDYWVWGPIIESLGFAGYDETRMSMMSYDWRYALRDLEHRTKYFSRLMHEIEKLYAINNKEAVLIITHSFGSKVWFFFMQWVSHHFHPDWIDTHVAVVYNIAPVLLGLPKAISALLSGDTRDTAQMGALSSLVDALIPPSDRVALTSSWGSIFDMLPAGDSRVWEHPMMFLEINNTVPLELSAEESINLLMNTNSMSAHALHQNSSQRGQLRCPPTEFLSDCYMDEWTDPLISPLPRISRMKIWAAYGIGIPTEIGYNYTLSSAYSDNTGYKINTTHSSGNQVVNGVRLGDGDGTVPIQSLKLVPSVFWNQTTLNPGNLTVRIRELVHGETYSVFGRSFSVGGSSVDHVDIMGNREIIRDVLHLALGLDEC